MLLSEAAQRSAALPEFCRTVETVYIGGGTPSLLPPDLLVRLIDGLKRFFAFAPDIEFSIEANPGTVTQYWAETASGLGINRISLGMQAKQPDILRTLGRIHSFNDVERSVHILRSSGFSNLSLDLMFGIPGQSLSDWRECILAAVSLQPEHISAYGLIPEEGTPLYEDLKADRCTLPDPEDERKMYTETLNLLFQHGYVQYEISNFALPGFACRHNIGYWTQVPYLGLGISAASMFPVHDDDSQQESSAVSEKRTGYPCLRQKNPVFFEDYKRLAQCKTTSESNQLRESETVSAEESRFETMMLGLRMNEGVSEADFRRLHGVTLESVYGQRLRSLANRGLLVYDHGICRLTRKGMDLQNSVLVELM